MTDRGTVIAEHVVNAAGLWARDLGRLAGIELPVQAMEHHYIVTEPVPELQGLEKEIVIQTISRRDLFPAGTGRHPDGNL